MPLRLPPVHPRTWSSLRVLRRCVCMFAVRVVLLKRRVGTNESTGQSRRRTAAANLVITAEIATGDPARATAVAKAMQPTALNAALAREGLPDAELRSVTVLTTAVATTPNETALAGGVSGGVSGALILVTGAIIVWRRRRRRASRRLIGSMAGSEAGQDDLPAELRSKYEAVRVLGCVPFRALKRQFSPIPASICPPHPPT